MSTRPARTPKSDELPVRVAAELVRLGVTFDDTVDTTAFGPGTLGRLARARWPDLELAAPGPAGGPPIEQFRGVPLHFLENVVPRQLCIGMYTSRGKPRAMMIANGDARDPQVYPLALDEPDTWAGSIYSGYMPLSRFLRSLGPPTSGLPKLLLRQIVRLGGVPPAEDAIATRQVNTVAGPRTLSRVVSGLLAVKWPADRTFVSGEPAAALSLGWSEVTERLASGYDGPLLAIAHDVHQYFAVVRVDDISDDPLVHRLDHDGSSTLDAGVPLSRFLAAIKRASPGRRS
ncbi:MAG TPA: hypothetical protein VGB85_27980 [Nannocystis sp.]|jgi:hypothetical protein